MTGEQGVWGKEHPQLIVMLTYEDHHFRKEGSKYYRVSKIFRQTLDANTGKVLKQELIRDNHSEKQVCLNPERSFS